MKGEIFNLLEKFISKGWGEASYEDIYDIASSKLVTKEPFVGPGTYPDCDFTTLLETTVRKLSVSLPTAARAFGKFCYPHLAARVPDIIETFAHPKDLLMRIDDLIHVEVKKVFRDARPPRFSYRDVATDKLIMIYESPRRFYDFFEGLIEGVADEYRIKIDVKRKVVVTEGSEKCEFELTFSDL